MVIPRLFPLARGLALLVVTLVAGCSSNPLPSAAPEAVPATPAVAMAGRWRLVSANGGACGMTFGAGASAGTIAPEGGCPANFFTSRHWILEKDRLLIQDHRRNQLVAMMQNAGRFEGELASREVIWLER